MCTLYVSMCVCICVDDHNYAHPVLVSVCLCQKYLTGSYGKIVQSGKQ